MAHLLTAVRLALAVPFGFWMAQTDPGLAWVAAVAMVIAIATDLADGPVARRTGRASAAGRAFDHASDFTFVTAGLIGGAVRGVFPGLLPALVILAFAQYVVDSYWLHRERQLRMSQLGRWNGVLYFVPLCGDLLVRTGILDALGLGVLSPLVGWIAWGLVVSTLLSIGDRVFAVSRRAPG
jgi:phosphatidylglycerophosphate synthase